MMNYKLMRQNKPVLPNYGKFKAVAVHCNTIGQREVEQEIQDNCSAKASDVRMVLAEFAAVLNKHLRNGDRLRLDRLGLFKLEIESKSVDDPADFSVNEHIKGVRIHFLPESYHGRQAFYEDIEYRSMP